MPQGRNSSGTDWGNDQNWRQSIRREENISQQWADAYATQQAVDRSLNRGVRLLRKDDIAEYTILTDELRAFTAAFQNIFKRKPVASDLNGRWRDKYARHRWLKRFMREAEHSQTATPRTLEWVKEFHGDSRVYRVKNTDEELIRTIADEIARTFLTGAPAADHADRPTHRAESAPPRRDAVGAKAATKKKAAPKKIPPAPVTKAKGFVAPSMLLRESRSKSPPKSKGEIARVRLERAMQYRKQFAGTNHVHTFKAMHERSKDELRVAPNGMAIPRGRPQTVADNRRPPVKSAWPLSHPKGLSTEKKYNVDALH